MRQRSSVAKERWEAMVRRMGKLGGSEFRSTNTHTHTDRPTHARCPFSLALFLSLSLLQTRTQRTQYTNTTLSTGVHGWAWPCYLVAGRACPHTRRTLTLSLSLPLSLPRATHALVSRPSRDAQKDETSREGKKKGEDPIVIANEHEEGARAMQGPSGQ